MDGTVTLASVDTQTQGGSKVFIHGLSMAGTVTVASTDTQTEMSIHGWPTNGQTEVAIDGSSMDKAGKTIGNIVSDTLTLMDDMGLFMAASDNPLGVCRSDLRASLTQVD